MQNHPVVLRSFPNICLFHGCDLVPNIHPSHCTQHTQHARTVSIVGAPDGRDLVVERLLEGALVPLLAVAHSKAPQPQALEGDALRGGVHEVEAAASM